MAPSLHFQSQQQWIESFLCLIFLTSSSHSLILLCIRVSVSIRFPRWEGIVKAASCLLSKPCTDKCRVLLSGLFTTHSLPTGSFLTLLLGYFYKFGYDHGFPRLMAPHCQQDRVQTLGIHPGSFSGSLGPLGSRYQDGI